MVAGLMLRDAAHGEGGGGDGGGGDGGGDGGGGRINVTDASSQQLSFRPEASAEIRLALSSGQERPHDTEGSRSQSAVTIV